MPRGDPEKRQGRVDLSLVDVEEFLLALRIQNVTHADADMRFSCPYPEHAFGDKTPSAYMNKDTTAFICFGCSRTGNAVTFLADVMNVTRTVARYWIAQKWSPFFVEVDDLTAYLRTIMEGDEGEDEIIDVVLDESELETRRCDWQVAHQHFMNGLGEGPLGYVLDRGFTPEILTRFEVCYDEISQRPCVTVRDEHGRLVGFKGRAWHDGQVPKYMVVGDTERGLEIYGERYGFAPYDASRYVFALDRATPIDGTIIFCEGELNVISMHDKGFMNTVGPSGSTVSVTQVEQIVRRCEEVIVLMDYDLRDQSSAFLAQVKIGKVAEMFEPYVRVRIAGRHENDPNTMSREEIERLIVEATTSTTRRVMQALGLTAA